MEQNNVYRFEVDFRRGGGLMGVFLATQQEVDLLIDSKIRVYFGEVNGKHSEVYCPIEKGWITLISDNPEVLKVVSENRLTNGHNPFNYTAIDVHERYEDWTVDSIITYMIENGLKTADD